MTGSKAGKQPTSEPVGLGLQIIPDGTAAIKRYASVTRSHVSFGRQAGWGRGYPPDEDAYWQVGR